LVANVGDSDVVVFDGALDAGRSVIASHTATTLSEWERVHEAHPYTEFKFVGESPPQQPVWKKEHDRWVMGRGQTYTDVRKSFGAYVTHRSDTNTLAMTRSLGDFQLKQHGVIATPGVQCVPAPAPGTTRAVVAASDGVWDALHYEQVRELVYRQGLVGKPDRATAELLQLALTEARREFKSQVVDNLICAVIYIISPDIAPRRAASGRHSRRRKAVPAAPTVVAMRTLLDPGEDLQKLHQARPVRKTRTSARTSKKTRTSQKTRTLQKTRKGGGRGGGGGRGAEKKRTRMEK
jgi:hypothetical protein